MRRIVLLAASMMAIGTLQVGMAEACIKFDRAAEMALIDEALTASSTEAATKAELRALRKSIVAIRKKTVLVGDDVSRHDDLTRKALGLIGKQRIVRREPDSSEKPRRVARTALPACG